MRDVLRERGLQYVLLVVVVAVLAAAAVELALEREEGSIDNYGTALWWSLSTLLTVGYGDVVPETAEGKAVAAVLMVSGIAFLA